MTIPFRDFPVSYRLAQSGIGFVLLALAIGGFIFRLVPLPFKIVAWSVFGAIAFCSLVISHYVIIRYPFISLVEPAGGDPFTHHFKSHGSWLYTLLKLATLFALLVTATIIVIGGIRNIPTAIILAYCVVLVIFMLFFTFWYDPNQHPTIATFIRSTLGLGILLYPLYSVTILIGAWRCRQALTAIRE